MLDYEKGVLSKAEWETLAQFGLKHQSQAQVEHSIESIDLLDREKCLAILEHIMPSLGAPDLKVTASLVIKRIAFLALAPTLYAMSIYNKGLNLAINNSVFEHQLDNRLWKNGTPIKNTGVSLVLDNRTMWRDDVLRQVFTGHLTQLVQMFHQTTGVAERILWENIAVRVFSIYERRILNHATGKVKTRAETDFSYLLDAKTHKIYGLDENPLIRFYRKTMMFGDPPKPVRMRRTCCFYYQATEPEVYCSNCPLLLKRDKR